MLQARYEDGSPISDDHIADELLTLLAAGHETTATTLAWTVERLRRHPRLLVAADRRGRRRRHRADQATIWEVQRTRPVIDGTARMTRQRMRLGEWVIPERSRRDGEHLAGASVRARTSPTPRPSTPIDSSATHPTPYVDPLRRRHPALHRRRVRQHGDERDIANAAARVRVRHHVRRGGAPSFPRRRDRARARRPGGRVPASAERRQRVFADAARVSA